MATVTETIQESISKDAIIADREIQISTLQAQITDYEKIIAATDPVLGATLISEQIENKLENKLKEIEDLTKKKQEISDKPLSDFERAELARSYQRRIEIIEKEKAELETLTAKLANGGTFNLSGGDGVVGSYMKYRGIENRYGHIWKWVDGI